MTTTIFSLEEKFCAPASFELFVDYRQIPSESFATVINSVRLLSNSYRTFDLDAFKVTGRNPNLEDPKIQNTP